MKKYMNPQKVTPEEWQDGDYRSLKVRRQSEAFRDQTRASLASPIKYAAGNGISLQRQDTFVEVAPPLGQAVLLTPMPVWSTTRGTPRSPRPTEPDWKTDIAVQTGWTTRKRWSGRWPIATAC